MRGLESNDGGAISRSVDVSDSRAAFERRVRVGADLENLATLREQTKAFVRQGGGGGDLAEDFGLAVSELATNVVQHSGAEYITVTLRRDDESWRLDVDDADGVPEIDAMAAPEASTPTGRGLVVVRAIMDDVRVVEVGGGTVLRCVKWSRT